MADDTYLVLVKGGPQAGWHDRQTWERLKRERYTCCNRSVLGWHALRCPVAGLGVAENWTCWLCGGPVEPKSHGPWGPSIDHVHPRSRGGNDVHATNHRLAHRSCNSRRGNAPARPAAA